MAEFIDGSDPSAIARAERALMHGGVIVLPTDTVYGLAARVDRPQAIDRIFSIKKRMRVKPIAVLVSTAVQASKLAVFDEEASAEAERVWPGAVTLVLPRSERAPSMDLGGDPATIGLRVPDHPAALALLERVGPLAATSANLAGDETPASVSKIAEVLGEDVDLYIDGGELGGKPSQVISLIGERRTLR